MSTVSNTIPGLVVAGVFGAPLVWAVPEYLQSEEPVSADLERQPSATAGIARDASGPFDWEMVRPSRFLPEWRKAAIAETGNPFFDEMGFALRPRFYYFHRDFDTAMNQESAALGGSLSVETGWWKDSVRVGFTGYTSQKIYGPSDRDGLGLLAAGQKGYSALGEAFVDLKFGETRLRAGRTRVDLPFINDHDIRMTPYTFEGIGLSSEVIPDLQLGLGHITRIKPRTESSFESMSEKAGVVGVDRGVTAVSARYDLSEDAFVAVTEQYGWDMYNTVYAEAEHLFHLGEDWKFRLRAQFTDQRSVGDELLGSFVTQQAGAEFALEYGAWIGTVSFTTTGDGASIQNPWGGQPTYHSMMISDFDRPDEESWRLAMSYDFSDCGIKGLSANASWVSGNTPDSGKNSAPDEEEFNVTIDYRPPIQVVDDFWLRLRWAQNDEKGGGAVDRTDIRVILNYSYLF